jgi:hypothetical protein
MANVKVCNNKKHMLAYIRETYPVGRLREKTLWCFLIE